MMGELYNPYPKLPKNIRQIGERDQIVKLYVEDYVNTYLKRLYPTSGQGLRVGILLGEVRSEDGLPYLFVDGAMEMEEIERDGEKFEFTEAGWKRAYQVMEQMFPKRSVLGWFLCGSPGCVLSPLNYWKQHNQYFSGKNQLMYLNSGLEGEEAIYTASEEGFYKLRGYCVYYERNQMMQDYMVSRKDVRRVESGMRDGIVRDFRQRMEEGKAEVVRRRSVVSTLETVCGVLTVVVLAGGVVLFNNYQKMKDMESVIASVMPQQVQDELEIEELPGEVMMTRPVIVSETEYEDHQEIEIEAESGGDKLETMGIAESVADDRMTYEPGSNGIHQQQIDELEKEASAPMDAVVHIVQNGETLYGICMERYGNMGHLEEICAWNQLENENRIKAGQKLLLPPQ